MDIFINPFDAMQRISFVDDENNQESIYCSIDDIPKIVTHMSNQFGIQDVNIFGSNKYNEDIVKRIVKKEKEEYSTSNLKINLIGK